MTVGDRLRSALSMALMPFVMMGAAIRDSLAWTGRQAAGTWRNTKSLWRYATFDRLLPPAIVSTIQFYFETIPRAFGLRGTNTNRMVTAVITLMLVLLLSSIITFGLTLGLVIGLTIFLLIGLLRLVPAINRVWRGATSGLVDDDYDIPRWHRD